MKNEIYNTFHFWYYITSDCPFDVFNHFIVIFLCLHLLQLSVIRFVDDRYHHVNHDHVHETEILSNWKLFLWKILNFSNFHIPRIAMSGSFRPNFMLDNFFHGPFYSPGFLVAEFMSVLDSGDFPVRVDKNREFLKAVRKLLLIAKIPSEIHLKIVSYFSPKKRVFLNIGH